MAHAEEIGRRESGRPSVSWLEIEFDWIPVRGRDDVKNFDFPSGAVSGDDILQKCIYRRGDPGPDLDQVLSRFLDKQS